MKMSEVRHFIARRAINQRTLTYSGLGEGKYRARGILLRDNSGSSNQ